MTDTRESAKNRYFSSRASSNSHRLSFILSVSVSAVIAFGMSASTDARNSEGFSMEEVVVTARKREENLQDTPVSIAAYTGTDLKYRQVDSSEKIGMVTPNLEFAAHAPASGNNASSQVFIRGIGQTDFLPSTDPGVGIYLDGAYIARSSGGAFDFIDLERIEILRGPQGTLFGRNTIGGAIVVHSRKPSDVFSGYIETIIGDDNRRDILASIDIPIGNNLRSSLVFADRNQDGYVTRLVDGEDLGNDNSLGGQFKLLWTPSNNTELYLILDHVEEDEHGSPQVFNSINSHQAFSIASSAVAGCPGVFGVFFPPVPPPGPTRTAAGDLIASQVGDTRCANNQFDAGPYHSNASATIGAQTGRSIELGSEFEVDGVNFQVQSDFEDFTFKSITTFRDMRAFGARDADNTPLTVLHTVVEDEQDQFSQEFQLSGNALDSRLNWLVGLYYFEEEIDEFYLVETAAGSFQLDANYKNDTSAAFTQLTYDATDNLSFTAGLRYTTETKRVTPDQRTLTNYALPTGLLPPNTPFFTDESEREEDISEVTPMLSASYRWNDNIMTYLSYSEGFKSGGFNTRNIAPLPDIRLFSPEYAKTTELGYKATLFDKTLRVNGAVFATDYTDLQFVVREGFAPIVFNAGEAEISGLEVELEWIPNNHWLITGGIGYTVAEYKELSKNVIDNGGVSKDNELAFTPRLTASIGIAYSVDINNTGTLTPRIDWSHQDEKYFDAVNTEAIAADSFQTFNAALIFESADGNWELKLAGSNLTDEVYRIAGFSSLSSAGSYAESVYARPRSWELDVKWRF